MGEVETIGERIKRERAVRDMTQRELADKVGVGAAHISKVEADRENPGEPLLHRLALVFGIDVKELFLVARRLPEDMAEVFAEHPRRVVELYRSLERESNDDLSPGAWAVRDGSAEYPAGEW